jgi:hypothetical protein
VRSYEEALGREKEESQISFVKTAVEVSACSSILTPWELFKFGLWTLVV